MFPKFCILLSFNSNGFSFEVAKLEIGNMKIILSGLIAWGLIVVSDKKGSN